MLSVRHPMHHPAHPASPESIWATGKQPQGAAGIAGRACAALRWAAQQEAQSLLSKPLALAFPIDHQRHQNRARAFLLPQGADVPPEALRLA